MIKVARNIEVAGAILYVRGGHRSFLESPIFHKGSSNYFCKSPLSIFVKYTTTVTPNKDKIVMQRLSLFSQNVES